MIAPAATLPPITSLLRLHAYRWIATTVPYEVVVDVEPVGTAGGRVLASKGRAIAIVDSPADARWGTLGRATDVGEQTYGARDATGLDDDVADLVVWAPVAWPEDRWRAVAVEARRIARPGARFLLVLDGPSAKQVEAHAADFEFGAATRLAHRAVIGSAIGDAREGGLDAEGPDTPGCLLLLGDPDGLDLTPSMTLGPGHRALHLERGARSVGAEHRAARDLGEIAGDVDRERAALDAERAALDAERAALDAELAALDAELAAFEGQRGASLSALQRAEDSAEQATRDKHAVAEVLADLEGCVAQERALVAQERAAATRAAVLAEETLAELGRARNHKHAIENSLTWRATEPLRRIKRELKR